MLLGKGLMAVPLHDLRPLEVLVEIDFKLKNDEPMYHKPRRMYSKHNIIVKTEMKTRLRAGVINLM